MKSVRAGNPSPYRFACKDQWQISLALSTHPSRYDDMMSCIMSCGLSKQGSGLACPRVEAGLLAVKAAVEPKNVVMAAILMRECQSEIDHSCFTQELSACLK